MKKIIFNNKDLVFPAIPFILQPTYNEEKEFGLLVCLFTYLKDYYSCSHWYLPPCEKGNNYAKKKQKDYYFI